MTGSVFFDLDGTLTDPQEGITRCIQCALSALGAAPPERSELLRFIGPPLQESLAELLGYPGEETVAEALRLFRRRFESIGMTENVVYPGVIDMLTGVRDHLWRSYVVTSKPEPYAQRIVQHFALDDFFDRVYGSGLDGARVRKADLIRHVLAQESIPSGDAVMVGDRMHDVRGALANNMPAIGVAYGYGSSDELRAAGATWICDTPLEVFHTLVEHFVDR